MLGGTYGRHSDTLRDLDRAENGRRGTNDHVQGGSSKRLRQRHVPLDFGLGSTLRRREQRIQHHAKPGRAHHNPTSERPEGQLERTGHKERHGGRGRFERIPIFDGIQSGSADNPDMSHDELRR